MPDDRHFPLYRLLLVLYILTQTVSTKVENTRPNTTQSPAMLCSLDCLNNGVCRVNTQTDALECVCKADYHGQFCEYEIDGNLTACTTATCKHGGTCTGEYDSPMCRCKQYFSGKHCERVQTLFNTTVHTRPEKDIHDPQSMEPLCKLIQEIMESGNHLPLVNGLANCEQVTKNYNTNMIIVNLAIDTRQPLTNISILNEHLNSGLEQLAVKMSAIKTFEVHSLMDPCSIGTHDCSVNARCINKGNGDFTCACESFTIDRSLDATYPGRRCLYDALIISSFAVAGSITCTLTILLCGCRGTLWRRNSSRPDTIDLINYPSSYEI